MSGCRCKEREGGKYTTGWWTVAVGRSRAGQRDTGGGRPRASIEPLSSALKLSSSLDVVERVGALSSSSVFPWMSLLKPILVLGREGGGKFNFSNA